MTAIHVTLPIRAILLCMVISPLFCGCDQEKISYGLYPDATVQEAGSMSESSHPIWWVNSGGYMYIDNFIGRTVQGVLPPTDQWRKLYARNNPVDTDNGTHPQNIFRLIIKKRWTNINQLAYFRMNACNTSDSPQRAGDNGIVIFSRYDDEDNLYYAGIRVDGRAVIKKKQNGSYSTLASKSFFPGSYDRIKNPNLIPMNKWIGLYMSVTNLVDGTAHISLAIDKGNHTAGESWIMAVEAHDSGGADRPIIGSGHAGIRTDFMDVEFKGYIVREIDSP